MVWFLERESEVLVCELRQVNDGSQFELATRLPGQAETVERFGEPTRLLETWLARQQQLHQAGWRPKGWPETPV